MSLEQKRPAPRVMGIDPSSKLTGYALLKSLAPDGLLDGGLFKPSIARELLGTLPRWLQNHLMTKDCEAYRRIFSMCKDVQEYIAEMQPQVIVVEVPSGKCGTGSTAGAKGSLTTYGAAAGLICGAALAAAERIGAAVVPVTERQWPIGFPKWSRPVHVKNIYGSKRYDAKKDKGADLADAIMIGRWWITNQGAAYGAA